MYKKEKFAYAATYTKPYSLCCGTYWQQKSCIMIDFKKQNQVLHNVIECYRNKGYSEPVLTALKDLLTKHTQNEDDYDELAAYFDDRLQLNGVL